MKSVKRNYPYNMFNSIGFLLFWIMLSGSCKRNNVTDNPLPPPDPPVATDVLFYLTQGDQHVLFNKQNVSLLFTGTGNASTTIEVDTTQTFQSIDGFGYTLTGGSATLLNALPATTLDP
ncbi:MAG TPA: glucosylceramidase, partial [Niastella sp.]